MASKANERSYNIPLRKETHKSPKYRRAKKAVSAVKQFITKHMKVSEVKLGQALNHKLWQNGIKNPPHHVNVTVKREDDVAKVELTGTEYKEFKVTAKEEKVGGLKGKLEQLKGKSKGEGLEEVAEKEAKATEKKEEQKEVVKEVEKVVEEAKKESKPAEKKEVKKEAKEEVKESKPEVKKE